MNSIPDLSLLHAARKRVIGLQILVFMALGAYLPFLSVYLRHTLILPSGSTAYELVGILFFIQASAGMIGTPIAGYIADRFKIENRILFVCSLMMIFSFILLLLPGFPGGGTLSFSQKSFIMAPAMFLNGLFFRPIIPIIDTATLDYLHRARGNGSGYGGIRLFGSLSWAVSASAFGAFLWFSGLFQLTLIGAAAGFFLLAVVAMSGFKTRISVVRIPWEHLRKDGVYRAVLAFSFLMGLAVNSSFTFTSYLMEDAHATYLDMGLAFGLSGLPEIPLMYFASRIRALLGNRGMMISGSVVMLLKLVLLVVFAGTRASWIFIIIHGLHGIGYSFFFLGIIDMIDTRAHEDLRATYQNLYHLVWSFATAVGGLFAGFVIRRQGNIGLMRWDALIVLVAILFFFVFVKRDAPVVSIEE